nr:MAG TPA: hypothetical protein [Bacteriophage sp.]
MSTYQQYTNVISIVNYNLLLLYSLLLIITFDILSIRKEVII